METKWQRWVGVAALTGLGTIRCGGDSESEDYCDRASSKLRQCELLSDGIFDCDEPEGPVEACEAQCLLSASCNQLEAFVCPGGGSNQAPIFACMSSCEEQQPMITCDNGSEMIPSDWQCDGDVDCSDGSDELGCPDRPMHPCAGTGIEIPEAFVCDGVPHCPEGDDEAACPTFDCGDGEMVPADWQCDGDVDCSNGNDELGCPDRADFVCPAPF